MSVCARVWVGQTRLPFIYYSVAPLSAVPNFRNSKTENFLFPQTPTLKKKVKTESVKSQTAFGFDFLKQKNSAKLVSG